MLDARCCGATLAFVKKMVGPVAKREAVAHLQAVMGLSERRACGIVGANRKMVWYRSCRPPDTELRGHLRELANARRRFGYRRLFVLLRLQGEPSGETGSTVCLERKASACASAGPAAAPWAPER